MTEHGPFRAQEDLSLTINDYSWNKVANILYIESPLGVGFSYAENTSAYNVNDRKTADYNFNAIQSFFNKFPQYRSNDFHITAESYGGHYMPELALKIVTENDEQENPDYITNFKGFAVGNPLTGPLENYYGAIETYWGHQVISYPTYKAWKNLCTQKKRPSACVGLEIKMYQEIGNLNFYALDYPVCNTALLSQRLALLNYITPEHLKPYVALSPEAYEPCTDNYATEYLNRADVQNAIHANPTTWEECSDSINYTSIDGNYPMEPLYHYLIDGGYDLKILVYSGDDDTVCATLGTQEWIYRLGYNETNSWNSWSYTDAIYGEQLGGYLVQWEGLSFATVHGAGHEVPTYKPEAALQLFENYLNGVF
jgi:carboxypeptidase C (cathepsin A)